jgi:hypothetical protein
VFKGVTFFSFSCIKIVEPLTFAPIYVVQHAQAYIMSLGVKETQNLSLGICANVLTHSTPWPLFLTYFMDSKRSKCSSSILEFHFFVFQNFDCEPRYAWFSICLCLNVAFLFLHLSLCYFFLSNAPGLLNPKLFKFLRYLYPFLRYVKRAYFFLTVRFTVCAHFLKRCNFLVHPLPWNFIWMR